MPARASGSRHLEHGACCGPTRDSTLKLGRRVAGGRENRAAAEAVPVRRAEASILHRVDAPSRIDPPSLPTDGMPLAPAAGPVVDSRSIEQAWPVTGSSTPAPKL